MFRKSQPFTNVLFCWYSNSIFIKQNPWSSLTCFPNSVNAMGPFHKDTAMTQPVGNCSAVRIQICLYHKMWRWLWILEATKWAILEYFPNFQPDWSRVIGSIALIAQSIIKVRLDLKATTGWTLSLCHMITCWQLFQEFNSGNHNLEVRRNRCVDYSSGWLESNFLS